MTNDRYGKPTDPAGKLKELRSPPRDKSKDQPAEPMAEDEEAGDGESFSTLSADRQQKIMLELRFKDGNARAFPYNFMAGMAFNPSKGIEIDFTGYNVAIEGRNLRPLFSGLVAQRVAYVQEMDELYAEATLGEDETAVTRIEINDRA